MTSATHRAIEVLTKHRETLGNFGRDPRRDLAFYDPEISALTVAIESIEALERVREVVTNAIECEGPVEDPVVDANAVLRAIAGAPPL